MDFEKFVKNKYYLDIWKLDYSVTDCLFKIFLLYRNKL